MSDLILKERTLAIAESLDFAHEFQGWDGEFVGIYLPEVGGGADIGAIQRQLSERREGRDYYTVDLGHRRFGLTHSQAKQFMAKLSEAKIPYETRSKQDADWDEHNG